MEDLANGTHGSFEWWRVQNDTFTSGPYEPWEPGKRRAVDCLREAGITVIAPVDDGSYKVHEAHRMSYDDLRLVVQGVAHWMDRGDTDRWT
jgi:hypothetical protein